MLGESLFIYGSFSEGMVHFEKISKYIKEKHKAWARGSVYRLEVGFPVLLAEGSSRVEGTLVKIKETELLLSILDEFHGYSSTEPAKSLYFREEITVETESSVELQPCFTYRLNPAKLPSTAQLLVDGDWKTALSKNPALIDSLTDRQKCYIQKLSVSSRRDTIVYPLDVCRDLERRQLIVDKGRRFALTNLGLEVSRYL